MRLGSGDYSDYEEHDINSESTEGEESAESEGDESDLESADDESNSEFLDDESNSELSDNESSPESVEDKPSPQSEPNKFGPEPEQNESNAEDMETKLNEDLRTKIWSALQKLEMPTAFAFSAIPLSLPLPCLYLPDHGVLGLPLSTHDAQKIISEASQSPFGRGEETIIDTSVRKSWELNPKQFSLKNPAWGKAIEKIIISVRKGLGLKKGTGNVRAELHKLLLYEQGAFFKPHKDSEKAQGMFGTLVICLPAPHEGGKLILTRGNEKYEFETAASASCSFSYCAWYSDITHEIMPVTSGYRVMLTYNLIREEDFELPTDDLINSRVQHLSTLLEEYKSHLEKENEGEKLPPILLHRLKHKYTQANLKHKLLKPQDFAQVQMLSQLSTKLGFDIYLAILELEVKTDDEYPAEKLKERSWSIENIAELDGKLVVEWFEYPEGALIDPEPQDARKADEEKHEGDTGNQGSPATYWYRDTVVVLVPPSKRLDFIFQFSTGGRVVESQFLHLLQELCKDPAQKPKLEQLCARALKKEPTRWIKQGDDDYKMLYCDFFQQVVTTAFDIDCIYLFDEACAKTGDRIILKNGNAHMLGRWAARKSVAELKDALMKGVRIASSVAKKVEFLKSVAEGFETVVEVDSVEKTTLKQWSDEAILTAVAELKTLEKKDAVSLAQLSKTINWGLFESKVTPIILKEFTMVKMAFINELLSVLPQELAAEQQSFLEMIIHSIWNKFVFRAEWYRKSKQKMSFSFFLAWSERGQDDEDDVCEDDIIEIVDTSVKILSSDCIETTVIPAMLSAIPFAAKECAREFFITLVGLILKNKLAGFRLGSDDAVPPSSHKCLVQALLTKFLMESIKREPEALIDWSLCVSSCKCSDCSRVNEFLQNQSLIGLDIRCSMDRRKHLNEKFAHSPRDCDVVGLMFDVSIIRGKVGWKSLNSDIWRITKHRRGYEMAMVERMKSIENAKNTLSKLEEEEIVKGRLETYLQPYYSIVFNANDKELPDLRSLTHTSQTLKTNENATPNYQPNHKRAGSKIDVLDECLVKQRKYETNAAQVND